MSNRGFASGVADGMLAGEVARSRGQASAAGWRAADAEQAAARARARADRVEADAVDRIQRVRSETIGLSALVSAFFELHIDRLPPGQRQSVHRQVVLRARAIMAQSDKNPRLTQVVWTGQKMEAWNRLTRLVPPSGAGTAPQRRTVSSRPQPVRPGEVVPVNRAVGIFFTKDAWDFAGQTYTTQAAAKWARDQAHAQYAVAIQSWYCETSASADRQFETAQREYEAWRAFL